MTTTATTWCGSAEPAGACGTSLAGWCDHHFYFFRDHHYAPDEAAYEHWTAHVARRRRDTGVLKWDDDRGEFNCTVHPDAAVQSRSGNGRYFAEPTQGGSYLYRCGVCGASAWSGI